MLDWTQENAARAMPPLAQPPAGVCRVCGGRVAAELLPGGRVLPARWVVPEMCRQCAQAELDRLDRRQQGVALTRRWAESQLPAGAREWDFATALTRARELKQDPADLTAWEQGFHQVRTWHAHSGVLYLYGPEGVGKTVLGYCLARAAIEALGRPAPLWVSLPALVGLVEESYAVGGAARALEAQAMAAGLLVLDEVGGPGTERLRKRPRECLFKIINHRADHKLPTVVTSNWGPGELGAVLKDPHERTIARLAQGLGVLIQGKSFRLIQAEARW